MVVGYHYFPKHPYKYFNDPRFFSLQKRNIQPREGHTNYHSFQASRRPRPSGEKISRSAAPGGDSCHPSALKVTISTYKWACDQNSPGGVDPVFYIGGGDVHIHIYLYIYTYICCPVPSCMGNIEQVIIRIPINQSAWIHGAVNVDS